MKKITLVLILLTVIFSLTACGKSAEEKSAEQQAQAQATSAKLWGLNKDFVPPTRDPNAKHY